MKRILYIVRRPPGVLADEITDVILVSGVFEQPTSVLFAEGGIYQLLGLDARESPLKTLSSYDVESLYVSSEDLAAVGMPVEDIALDVRPASRLEVRELIARHDIILTD